jgi:Oxidoreductase molybdopterin binding domain
MSDSEDRHKEDPHKEEDLPVEGQLVADDPAADDDGKSVDAENAQVVAASRKHSRRSFAIAALGVAAGFGVYRWVDYSAADGMQPLPRRRMFQLNARLSREVFQGRALAPTYPLSRSEELRLNGFIGLKEAILPESWRLQLVGVAGEKNFPQYVADVTTWSYEYVCPARFIEGDHFTSVPSEPPLTGKDVRRDRAGMEPCGLEKSGSSQSALPAGTPGLMLTMADILKLPKHELVTEFKCVEGWSQIVHWGGVLMADFLEAYPPARKSDGSLPRYVYMETPNGDYYVGYDIDECRHPQTLLVTEMAGKPLTQLHGAPLRLHTPSKYGYKQIKRIGLIAYTDSRPDDYWTKLGYDWYAGL